MTNSIKGGRIGFIIRALFVVIILELSRLKVKTSMTLRNESIPWSVHGSEEISSHVRANIRRNILFIPVHGYCKIRLKVLIFQQNNKQYRIFCCSGTVLQRKNAAWHINLIIFAVCYSTCTQAEPSLQTSCSNRLCSISIVHQHIYIIVITFRVEFVISLSNHDST